MKPEDNVIPGFEKLSKQELFDMAAAHVLKNGKASMWGGSCSYKGIGCAAAPFLTPERREGNPGSWLTLSRREEVPQHEATFIQDLQLCHDAPAAEQRDAGGRYDDKWFIEQYKMKMKLLAKANNLSPAILG